MTTIVNNPPSSDNSGGPMGWIVLLIILLIIGFVAFVYGLPVLRRMQLGSPQVNVPSEIDININQTE